MSKNNIVFLNGVGSVGKTAIAKCLQELFEEPYLHVGVDHFFVMLAKKYLPGGTCAKDGIDFITEKSKDGPITKIHCAPLGKKLFRAMRKVMLALAKDGFNLIIDEVILGNEFEEYQSLFEGFNFITVGVFAPLDVIEQREKKRADRAWGLARWQYDIVHKDKKYDIQVDTSKYTAKDCAEKIKQFISQ